MEMLSMLKAEATSSGLPRLLMSAAVSAAKETIDAGYEISELGKSLDFISVMTYDFHGSWEKITGHNSPLYKGKTDQGNSKYYNIEFAMNYWKDKGVPAGKLLMGFATYGRTFKLASSSSCDIGVPATGAGSKGKYTGEAGILAYYEICSILPKATVKFSNDQKVPYACSGDNWIGYDNKESYRYKVDFLKAGKFGGAMVWTIDMDDFQGTFCKEGKYPLISRLKQLLGLNKSM